MRKKPKLARHDRLLSWSAYLQHHIPLPCKSREVVVSIRASYDGGSHLQYTHLAFQF